MQTYQQHLNTKDHQNSSAKHVESKASTSKAPPAAEVEVINTIKNPPQKATPAAAVAVPAVASTSKEQSKLEPEDEKKKKIQTDQTEDDGLVVLDSCKLNLEIVDMACLFAMVSFFRLLV